MSLDTASNVLDFERWYYGTPIVTSKSNSSVATEDLEVWYYGTPIIAPALTGPAPPPPPPSNLAFYANVSGTWKAPQNVYYKAPAGWREVTEIYYNDNGTWKLVQ